MVAVVSGNSLGLINTSRNILGGDGAPGNATTGRSGEQAFVNSATGNLVLQSQDEALAGVGGLASIIRTYNSQGLFNDDNGDNWRLGVHQRLLPVTGTVNTAGSTIKKVFGDGAEVVYAYDASRSLYVSTDGDGAHDTLSFDAGNGEWTWTDGSAGATETYDENRRLVSSQDRDGNTSIYSYSISGNLIQITDSSAPPQHLYFEYTGNNLTAIQVVSDGVTQTLTRYEYDALDRLNKVTVDLTPESSADNVTYVTTYTYDGTSKRVASISQSDGSLVSFTYEQAGGTYRVKTFTDGAGKVSTLTYVEATEGSGGTAHANNSVLDDTEIVEQEVEVPPYYYLEPGDTWGSIAGKLYGNAALGDVLRDALDNPTLTPAQQLQNLPPILIDSTTDSVHVRGSTWSHSSPVVESYTGDNGRILTTRHADGSYTSFEYDIEGDLAQIREHAQPPITPSFLQNFSVDHSGFDAFPGDLAVVEDGGWTLSNHTTTVSGTYDSFSTATYDADDYLTFRAEVTFGPDLMDGMVAFGLLNTDQTKGHTALFERAELRTTFKDGWWSSQVLGAVSSSSTYVIEVETSALGSTLYVYHKGGRREDGYQHSTSLTGWGDTRMFIEVQGAIGDPITSVRIDNISVSERIGQLIDGEILPEDPLDVITEVNAPSRHYNVQYGETWSSIAQQLYGNSSVADELQTDLGSPTLTNPQRLSDLPETLSGMPSSTPRVLNGSGGSSSPVVDSYFEGSRLVGTLHADGTLTSYVYDIAGNLVARRQHATPPSLPAWWQNFSADAGGLGTISSSVATLENGALTVHVSQFTDVFQDTFYDYEDYPVLRGELTTGPTPINGYFALGAINPTHSRVTSVMIQGDQASVVYLDGWFQTIPLGIVENDTTYVLEFVTAPTGVTLYFYEKGQPRESGYDANLPFADWDQIRMFFETNRGADSTISDVYLDNLSVSSSLGSMVGPWFAGESAGDTVDTFSLSGQSYEVQAGDTWESISLALYGISSVADELEAALGAPTLAPAVMLQNLPQILLDLDAQQAVDFDIDLNVALHTELQEIEEEVDPYYTVQSGDTWTSIASTVYGSADSSLVAALQAALGNPALTPGLHLTVAQTLSYGSGGSGIATEVIVASPLGLVTTLMNDTSGRLIGVRSPTLPGGTSLQTSFQYDSDGNVTSITEDPEGLNRVTTLEYDDDGNLTLSRDAKGNTFTRTYSSTNQLLSETVYTQADPDGSGAGQPSGALTTRYVYDVLDHLRFTVSAAGRVTEHRYNPLGQRASSIQHTDAVYDLAGLAPDDSLSESELTTWVSGRVLTQLQRVDYAYDFRGNVSTVTAYDATDASGNGVPASASVTHFVYDQRGQLLQTIDPRGDSTTPPVEGDYLTSFTYDGLGRVTSSTRWNSAGSTSTTVTVHNDANSRVEITHANGLLETRTFDTAGSLISVAYSRGAQALGTTTYDYDPDGRLRRVTSPIGVTNHVVYDAAGRKQFDVDGDGTLTEYVYDGASNLVKTVQYAEHANTALLVDGSNAPLASVDVAQLRASANGNQGLNRIVRAVYDEANRLIYSIDQDGAVTETRYDGASRVTDVITYATRVTIDAAANAIPTTIFQGLESADDRRSRSFHDAQGMLLGILDSGGYLVEYEYDAAGRLVRTIGYATPTPVGQRASGALADLRPTSDPDHDVVAGFFYDGQGRQVGVLDGEGYLTETIYDSNGNVAQTIRYDVERTYSAGATLASLRPTNLGNSQVRSFKYDGQNRLTEETNAEGTVTRYEYDLAGNLIGATRAVDTAEARYAQAKYDALGRLTAELTAEGSAQIIVGMSQQDIQDIWDQYGITHQYDLAGRRISTTDQNGNRTLFFYDADGRLAYTVNALGEVVETQYNALGQLIRTVSYTDPISVEDLSGGAVTATLTERVFYAADPDRDAWTQLTYTLTGRVETTTTAQGSQVTYTYNAFGDQTLKVERINATQSLTHKYTYDFRGQLTKTQWDPMGINTSQDSAYDAFGRLTSTTDALGKTTHFTYDRLGRVVTAVDRVDAARHTSYDAFGRVLTTRDAFNNTTTYTYDDVARSVVITTPEGISLTTVRNRHGQTATIRDGRNNTTTYEYDTNGRLTEVSDSLGTLNEQAYDRAGRLQSITDGNGIATTITYDAANRVFTRTVDSGGVALTTTYAYDGQGRIVTATDPRGIITRTEHDLDGRVRAVITDFGEAPHLNLRTEYQYDDADRLLFVREGVEGANPRTTQYVYDTLGRRMSEIVDPGAGRLNLTTSYQYDPNGNVVRKIDAEHQVTRFVYDAANRLKYTIDALGGVTGNTYDAEGRVVAVRRYAEAVNLTLLPESIWMTPEQLEAVRSPLSTDRVAQTVFDRDGRAVFTIDAMGGVTQREYDANGNVVRTHIYSERLPEATYSTPASVTNALALVNDGMLSNDRDVRTVFDARNQAAFTIDGAGAVVRHTFDDVGNVIGRTEFATLRSSAGVPDLAAMEAWAATPANVDPEHDRTTRMWYDGSGRLVYTLDAEGYLTKLGYDGAGNITSEVAYSVKPTITGSTALADIPAGIAIDAERDQATTRTYDGAGRLLSIQDAEGFTESYTYDAVGNRVTMTNKKNDVWTYVYDANRRLTEEHSPTVAITRMTRSGSTLEPVVDSASIVTRMTYDALGNVKTRTEAYGRPEARTTTYSYDQLGRQIRVDFPDVLVYSPALDNLNRAGAEVVAAEMLAASFSTVTYDTFGNATRAQDAAGNYSHKAYDKLGRVVYEVDAGRYVTRYTYDTFGNRTGLTRYANQLIDSGITESTLLDAGTISARINASSTSDRTVLTEYDRLNRVSRVTQPPAFFFEPLFGTQLNQAGTGSAATKFEYDAFGNVVKESRLVNPLDDFWADKFSYHDRKGNLSAQVDSLGFITTFTHDALGNVTRQLEYATALAAGTWSVDGYVTPAAVVPQVGVDAPASGYDRDIRFVYDRMNRKTEERLANFAHSSPGNVQAVTTADRVTSYGYDAIGNQTRTTAPNGASTYLYFDAIGRMTAVALPQRDLGNGTILTPLTEMGRDAFGNLTVQIERANGASASTEDDFTPGAGSADDRTSFLYVDAYGRVLQSRDASGAVRFASYNRRGDVAKEWQLVHGNNSVVSTLVTVYEYDKLGRQTAVVEPQKIVDGVATLVRSQTQYNAFGEVIARGVNGAWQEYFHYDQAGHLWRTNADDGVDKVYFYNTAGQVTSEIRSADYDLRSVASSASALNSMVTLTLIRTNTRYDLNGRIVNRQAPSFESATRRFVSDGIEPLVAGFTVGDIAVPSNSQAIYRQVVREGVIEYVVDPFATLDQDGGYYFTGSTFVQDPHYEVITSKYLSWRASVNVAETRVFEYRLASDPNGEWETAPVVGLPAARLGVDLSQIAPGNYEYRVSYTRAGETDPYTRATGTMQLIGTHAVEGSLRPDLVDDSGSVAQIGIGNITSPPPGATGLATYAGVTTQIIQIAQEVDSSGGRTFYWGRNIVDLRFQPFAGGALIELEYMTEAIVSWTDPSIIRWPSHLRTIALWFDDISAADAGLSMIWEDPNGGFLSGGVNRIISARVYDGDGVLRAQTLGPQGFAAESTPEQTEIIWKAPRDRSVITTFEVRLKGATDWQLVDVDRFGGFFVVDGKTFPNGTWEYRVSYTQNGVLTASAAGELDVMGGSYALRFGEEGEPPPPPPEAVAQVQVSDRPASVFHIDSFASTRPTVSGGGAEFEDGYDLQPSVSWSGDNHVQLSFTEPPGALTRVEIDYVTGDRPLFKNVGNPPRWRYSGTEAGVLRTLVFDDLDYPTTELTWTDDADFHGGISSVTEARIYELESQEWVLRETVTPSLFLPGRNMYWRAPSHSSVQANLQVRQLGEPWTNIQIIPFDSFDGRYLGASLEGFEGEYEYRIIYSGLAQESGETRILSYADGILTVPSVESGTPLTVTQGGLTFADGPGTLGNIRASGQILTWDREPQAGTSVLVRFKPEGVFSWQQMVLEGTAPYLVDLGPGTVEYEVIYYRSSPDAPYARSAGVLNGVAPEPAVVPQESIAPVLGANVGPVDFEIVGSAYHTSPPNGPPPTTEYDPEPYWSGDENIVQLSWEDVSLATVRVELDYITATRNSFDYYAGLTPDPNDAGWITATDPSQIKGVARTQYFTFQAGETPTGATLIWEDDPEDPANRLNGGIESVTRIRVYVLDQEGNWVLRFDRDGAAPVSGRSLYWRPPVNTDLEQVFRYRSAPFDAWTELAVGEQAGYSFVSIGALPLGNTYEYMLTYEQDGMPVSTARGEFSLSAVHFGSQIEVTQNVVTVDRGYQDLGSIKADGLTISWIHEPEPDTDTTVTVRSRILGTTGWNEQVVTGSLGGRFSATLTGSLSAEVEFEIEYVRSGQTAPYIRSSGSLNRAVPIMVTPATMRVRSQEDTFVTEPRPIEVEQAGSLAVWDHEAEPGTTMVFRYRTPESGTWSTLAISSNDIEYTVNLSALQTGTYFYELTYVRDGETEPYALASGTMVLKSVFRGKVLHTDTTTQGGSYVLVTPTPSQQLDRWGNAVAVEDESGNTTHYRYNQLGQLTSVQQAAAEIVDTTGGTVTTSTGAGTSRNYYDITGRLIGARDANGNISTAAYNDGGQLITETHADGGQKAYVYNSFGNLVEQTDELGFRTRNAYDKGNRLVQVTREIVAGGLTSGVSADVQVESFTYDEAGRRIAETNGEGETLRYDFDLNDQIVRRVTPSGYVTQYEYDALGKKSREINANGDEQSWVYDEFGRLVSSTDMGFADTHYEYNEAGMLVRKYGDLGQDITYEYDSVGRVVTIIDNSRATVAAQAAGLLSSKKVTTYEYDEQNRRTRERLVIDDEEVSDTRIEYDSVGRLKRVLSSLSSVEYSYDAAGNRTRIHATYFDPQRQQRTQDLWYTYDEMNRVLISQGVNTAWQIDIGTGQGIELTYNVGGQRITSRTYRPTISHVSDYDWTNQTIYDQWSMGSGLSTEAYGYDGLGRLISTDSEMFVTLFGVSSTEIIRTNEREYDRASREVGDTTISLENEALTTRVRTSSYDADGRVVTQSTRKNGQLESVVRFGDARYVPHFYSNREDWVIESYFDWTLGYDQAGVLRGYSVDVYDNNNYKYTTTYKLDYILTDNYLQTTEHATSSTYLPDVRTPQAGSTERVYNVHGEMVEFRDKKESKNNRFFAYNADGQVVTAVKGAFTTSAQGQQALRNALHRADNEVKAQHYFFANGQQVGSVGQLTDENNYFLANFDLNFTPVSPGYPTAVPSQVVVQEGETLRIIALRIFGDSSLWYIIAEENGLTDPDAQLTAGTVLQIPNEVVSLSNTSSAFKPFDITELLGDTTPTQPAPPPPRKKKGCGVLGTIIVVIVAIVVTVVTKGATANFFTNLLGSFWGGVAAASTGAVVGSAVSQGVGIAIGQRDSFSWKDVAAAGLTAGITQGVGAEGLNLIDSEILSAGFNNVVGQGVNIALGLQDEFNWGAVAAAAVSAPLARSAGKGLTDAMGDSFGPRFTAFAANLAANGVRQVASVSFNGGRIDYGNIFADAFGNALGNSIVSKVSSGGSLASTTSAGVSAADELSEVRVTAQRIPVDANGYRLTSNPSNSILDAGQIVSPDEARSGSDDALATVTISTDRWNEEKGEIYNRLRWGFLGLGAMEEDAATWNAERLYDAGFRPVSRARDAAVLLDGFSAYGHVKNAATGLWNLGVKAVGGAASLPYLLDSADAARSVQDWFGGARINVDAPFAEMLGQSLAPTVNQVQAWSEDAFGIGGSTLLGAAGEFVLDASALVGTGAAARRFLPELDVAFGSDARFLRSSDLGMGIERASPELIDRIAGKRTVLFAEPGSEELRYLDWIGAEASVGGPDYTHILLRQNPSKAAVLEEFLHGTQSKLGVIDRLGTSGFGSAETHVKDFMIRHQRMLGLSDEDAAILKRLREAGY